MLFTCVKAMYILFYSYQVLYFFSFLSSSLSISFVVHLFPPPPSLPSPLTPIPSLQYMLEQSDFLVVGVIGKQGVGKSTVMSLLAGTRTGSGKLVLTLVCLVCVEISFVLRLGHDIVHVYYPCECRDFSVAPVVMK